MKVSLLSIQLHQLSATLKDSNLLLAVLNMSVEINKVLK